MNNNILHKLFLTLTLVLLTLGASAQDKITVSGNVSDESGEPIIGATVMEALTTNGVVTDLDGNFKIQVKNEKATLKITYIGMIAQNIRVGNQRHVKVVLKDSKLAFEIEGDDREPGAPVIEDPAEDAAEAMAD